MKKKMLLLGLIACLIVLVILWIFLSEKEKHPKPGLSKAMVDYCIKNYTNDHNKELLYVTKDLNGDGNTELLLLVNNEVKVVCGDEEIREVGTYDFVTGTVQLYESASQKYPGVFYSYASGGINYYGYLEVSDTKLKNRKLWNEDYSGISSDAGLDRDKIEYESDDKDLVKESEKSCVSKYKLDFKMMK